jgi:5-formyltetrahydrofolate cyclo-ligase
VHVRSTESLMRRTGHHLNHAVQDYFGSGIPGNPLQAQKRRIRAEMRRRRRALTPRQQRLASRNLQRQVVRSALFRFSRRIAFTLARDGEIDPMPLLLTALKRGKACYLPVMNRLGEDRLSFRRWLPGQRLVKGAWGIPEPRLAKACAPRFLSLVFMPLVAFDAQGNRLGMGRGFYDRSFAFKTRTQAKSPVLVGLAHECQRVEQLEVASWDVSLGGIVTDRQWYAGHSG